MKNSNITVGRIWYILVAAVLALGLAGCDKKKEETNAPETPEKSAPAEEKDGGKKEEAPEKKDAEAPAPKPDPKPEPAPKPAAGGGGGAIEKQLLGYWGVDVDQMIKLAKEQMAAENGGQPVDPQQEQMAIQMITAMAGGIVMQFEEDGKATAHTPAGPQVAGFKIMDVNEATGEFKIEISPPNEEPDIAPATLKGDSLSIDAPGQPMRLTRITKAEFEKRSAEAGKAMKDALEGLGDQLKEGLGDQLQDAASELQVQPAPVPGNP